MRVAFWFQAQQQRPSVAHQPPDASDLARAFLVLAVVVVGVLLPGCAAQFAPNYDRTIVDGLSKANEEAMTLFASVSSGVGANTFPQRQKTYSELLGKFDALQLQAKIRPNPRPRTPALFSVSGGNLEARVAEATTAPTSDVLDAIRRTMTTMRETDKRRGLTSTLVTGFKGEFELSMQQALTYEKALER